MFFFVYDIVIDFFLDLFWAAGLHYFIGGEYVTYLNQMFYFYLSVPAKNVRKPAIPKG